eukprot:TRINITY_DN304_c0_g1_i7.p1 TRINITY_DN304_c0_g1~~TRINITY_DN304_c0_g1_i7.p1  ORF type:complete len:238 (-),score=-9.78 TRINITY_DN304_c0_g1_i7:799-1512(-)
MNVCCFAQNLCSFEILVKINSIHFCCNTLLFINIKVYLKKNDKNQYNFDTADTNNSMISKIHCKFAIFSQKSQNSQKHFFSCFFITIINLKFLQKLNSEHFSQNICTFFENSFKFLKFWYYIFCWYYLDVRKLFVEYYIELLSIYDFTILVIPQLLLQNKNYQCLVFILYVYCLVFQLYCLYLYVMILLKTRQNQNRIFICFDFFQRITKLQRWGMLITLQFLAPKQVLCSLLCANK